MASYKFALAKSLIEHNNCPMSAAKHDFECPKCGNTTGYNPNRLEKSGVCAVCGLELTPEQRQGISNGIDEAREQRELTRAVAFLRNSVSSKLTPLC